MSISGRSFFSTDDLDDETLNILFSRARLFSQELRNNNGLTHLFCAPQTLKSSMMALLFLEPSTRTRLSFEMAGFRLGLGSLFLDGGGASSSLVKGESLIDTVETVVAMKPELLVVRHGGDSDLEAHLRELPLPVVNAGSGMRGHPTQALLDAFTIENERGQVDGEKVLFVGDVGHSRVAQSNVTLLQRLGAHVGICGPEALVEKSGLWEGLPYFHKLNDGLEWCDVCMVLRIQSERHGQKASPRYLESYKMTPEKLKKLKPEGILLSPGPYVPGVEMDPDVFNDPRCYVRKQVENGVYIRASLISLILGLQIMTKEEAGRKGGL